MLDAEYRQALAAVRSFGQSGITVTSAVCASMEQRALALRSRWAAVQAVLPDFSHGPMAYADAVLALLDEYPASMVLPCHDGSIAALRRRRAELERRTVLPLASEEALDLAVDKTRTLSLAVSLGMLVPRSAVVDDAADVRAAMADIGYPAVVKPAWSWADAAGIGTRLSCEAVCNLAEAQRSVDRIQAAGGRAMIQQWLPGRRDAVSVFLARDEMWAMFAQTSHRELPALGGASVLCESLPLLPDICQPAEALIRAMGLDGCSMVEFRRDRDGRPVLMEVNSRLGGSVALAMSAGVDFPRMLWAWAMNEPLAKVSSYRVGVRRRWLAGDIENLRKVLKDGRQLENPSRTRALFTFLTDFVRRPGAIDVFAADDMKPGMLELRETVRVALRVPKPVASGPRPPNADDPRPPAGTNSGPSRERSQRLMRQRTTDTAIIGAGPYALALARRLQEAGIERRVFGVPMQFWRAMPPGMFLKSFGFATSIPTVGQQYTLPEYCRARGFEDQEPIAIANFAAYGISFQERFVADVESAQVVRLERCGTTAFTLTLDTGERVTAQRVVVATGLSHYEAMPDFVKGLPADLVSHTGVHKDFTRFAGSDVTVIGAGQSALQAAALLHEAGATVRILAREAVIWHTRMALDRPLIERLRNPNSVLGAAWKNWAIQHFPSLLHYAPEDRRIRFTIGHLGPSGAWWLRDRVEGKLPIHEGSTVTAAVNRGSRVRLSVNEADGRRRELDTDHVIAGTGFDVDVDRLPFMSSELAAMIARTVRAPRLSRHFESSVPGLYFVGPASAFSFGPLTRFVAGTSFTTSTVASHLARNRRAEVVQAAAPGSVESVKERIA